MLFYKAWRESKIRFLASVALIAAMCVAYVAFYAHLYPGVARDHPGLRSYTHYIYWTIFAGTTRGMFQLSCLLLGLGGLQRDRRQNSLSFTLALPVSRTALEISRAGCGALQLLALSMIPSLVLPLASHLAGHYVPLAYILRFLPLWFAGGLFTFGISFLASVVFSSEYVSLAAAYVGYVFYLAGVRHPDLRRFHLHATDFMSGLFPGYLDRATRLWAGTYPLAPLVGFLMAGILLMIAGMAVTERQDI